MDVLNVSVDKLTFVGGVSDRKQIDSLRFNHFVKWQGRAKFPYEYQWGMEDGSLLQMAPINSDVRPMRYEFNPNYWDSEFKRDGYIMDILRLMKNVAITRIDIAIDTLGDDLGKYTWIDLKGRKREKHEDGRLNMETLYIGSDRSETRLRIYNKTKERQDKEKIAKYENWWRVEAQLRGEDAGNYLELNPFSDLACVKKSGDVSGYDVATKAMLFYLQHHPEGLAELSKNTRPKYKQLLAATSEQAEISFSGIYEDSKGKIREIVETFKNLTVRTLDLEGASEFGSYENYQKWWNDELLKKEIAQSEDDLKKE